MGRPLDTITVSGFKSIRSLENFELRNLNVLIGGNGAGKSNFIEIFRLLREMMARNLGGYVLSRGGADDFLFNGPKCTKEIVIHFRFDQNEYGFSLEPTADEKFLIKTEAEKYVLGNWKTIGSGISESNLPDWKDEEGIRSERGVGFYVYDAVSGWTVYHFHDTGATAPMRRSEIVEDCGMLRRDGANIAPFLLRLRDEHPRRYAEIVDAVRLATPFFDDFLLDVMTFGEKRKVKLSWRQRGSDYPMQPYHLSDGTIRFICLTTALLQPNPPSTIIIDEPELGLHPAAISILSELIENVSTRTQMIVATQSPALIDHFAVEDIIVVNRRDGASTFERLRQEDFSEWLEDYSVGELWSKNVIPGGPVYE